MKLKPLLENTLTLFGRGAILTATEVHEMLGESDLTIPAMNYRLEELRKLRLLTRRKDGKKWLYQRAPHAPKKARR